MYSRFIEIPPDINIWTIVGTALITFYYLQYFRKYVWSIGLHQKNNDGILKKIMSSRRIAEACR